ncbi:MAG: CAP domain-containing protein [Paludibacteraceae bacterium]|nr:CAP domain-containing protein [Paludibacteraceae bacterium]
MHKWILMAASLLCLTPACSDDENDSPSGDSKDVAVNPEAKKAASLINDIRKNPSAYSSQMGVDLSGVAARPALNWNSALAKVAQAKAEDMAKNNYFSHVDLNGYGVNYFMHEAGYDMPEAWYKDKKLNYFENIAAGNATAEAMVKQLVYDGGKDNSSAGHRSSLLGISDWNSSCIDIGIGYAYDANSTYGHYWSVIIAKHNY